MVNASQLIDQQYEMVPVDALKPHPHNVNRGDVDAIIESIKHNRFYGAVVAQKSSGLIIAGKHRWLSARECGLKDIPVIWADVDDAAAIRMMLVDNRTTRLGTDDPAELAELLQGLPSLDGTGFDADTLDNLLAELGQVGTEGLTDEDYAPEPPNAPVTLMGDLWVLGKHRVLCGDATQMADIEKVLAGGLADMVFTDPPYNIDYEGRTKDKLKIKNDALGSKFCEFLRDASANMLSVCKGAVYICMSSSELHTLRQAFIEAGGHWSGIIIWVKNHFTLGWGDYRHQYEPILYGWREGGTHYWCGDRDQSDTWQIKRPAASREHPTMKPVELVERAIRNSSKTRDTILDPFGGSGSTLIACEKSGRQARVVELEPKYCDVIVRRWQEFTGKRATFDTDGRTFEEIATERQSVEDGSTPTLTLQHEAA